MSTFYEIAGYHNESISVGATYVASALVLPEDLKSFASCKHLTYLQPVQQLDDDSIVVYAAPLPHRLGMPGKYFTCVLSASTLLSAIAYDRRLASMATCDMRDLVEEHAIQMLQVIRQPRLTTIEVAPPSQAEVPERSHHHEHVQSPASPQDERASYVNGPTVTLSADIIQDIWARMKYQQHRAQSLRQLPVLLLRAALSVAEHLDEQALIRRVLVWRDRIPPRMEVTPIFARRRTGQQIVGYRVQVDVPCLFAA